MQSAPVEQHEHGGHNRERVGGGGVIENSCHAFERRQWRFFPYLGKLRPVPLRGELAQVEI
jgi:hypothetical protein